MPHLYGELDEDAIKARGFELIQHDTEWTAKGSPTKVIFLKASKVFVRFIILMFILKDGRSEDPEIKELTRESWEVRNFMLYHTLLLLF